MNFEIVPLKRNGNGYLISNFIFRKKMERGNSLVLTCREYKSGCKASAKINNGLAYLINDSHNHAPQDISCLKFRAAVIENAKTPASAKLSLQNVYNSTRQEILSHASTDGERSEILSSLPSFSAMRSTIHRAKVEVLPKNPTSLTEIDGIYVHQTFSVSDGSSFLLFDSGPNDPYRFMLFGNHSHLQRVGMCEIFHIDGTFWSAPRLFTQLLTVHTSIYGTMVPIFFTLFYLTKRNLVCSIISSLVESSTFEKHTTYVS